MSGNLTLEGTPDPLTIPEGAVSGYVWTTDADGNGSWQPPAGGSGSGTVTSVTATDASVVVSGTDTVAPAIATATLDVIATQHPPAANWSNNSKKITGLANGTASGDAAAFGQIPAALPPDGAAGGVLAGTYPNPGITTLNQNTTGSSGSCTGNAATATTAAACSGNSATATKANGLASATTTIAVSTATAPTAGQVLTATGTSAADWQTPAAGSTTLAGDTDTAISSPAPGQGLVWNGAKWANTAGLESSYAIGSPGASHALDVTAGAVQTVTLTANMTYSWATAPGSGAWSFTLIQSQNSTGGWTVTWPASPAPKWQDGIAPGLTSNPSATDMIVFMTPDGGTTWYGSLAGANYS